MPFLRQEKEEISLLLCQRISETTPEDTVKVITRNYSDKRVYFCATRQIDDIKERETGILASQS